MLKEVIDLIKFAASERSISGLRSTFRAFRGDVARFDIRVSSENREQLHLLLGRTTAKMEEFDYDPATASALENCFVELADNALEHGCGRDSDQVRFLINVNKAFTSVEILNPKSCEFDLEEALESARTQMNTDTQKSRGRGLLSAELLADSLQQARKGQGVKAVFYYDRVVIQKIIDEDLTVLRVLTGLRNPSCLRKLRNAIETLDGTDVIIDFRSPKYIQTSQWANFFEGVGRLRVVFLFLSKNQKRGVISDIHGLLDLLPDRKIAYSWSEALGMLDKDPTEYGDPE